MPHGFLNRQLPEALQDLTELALDLRWSTSLLTRRIWERLDPEAWERTENPYLMLLNVTAERLEAAANDQQLLQELARWRQKWQDYRTRPTWYDVCCGKRRLKRVAYFSMEFGLSEALPIYSGGLGMLAGDHLKSASDLGVPMVGIGIIYQQGYFRQALAADGLQREAFPYNDPSGLPVAPMMHNGRWARVSLELPGRLLHLRIWQARVGRVPLYLLDSNDPLNVPWDRGITASLYDAGRDKRLLQEIVLGVGGWHLLEQLQLDVDVCHLNEGHAAFAVLARAAGIARNTGLPIRAAFRISRAGNVFTTHTPVSAAFDEFDPGLVTHFAQPFLQKESLQIEQILALGRRNPQDRGEMFNMTFLAMRGCCHVNGVSQLHGHVSRRLFAGLYPGRPQAEIPIGVITNGVHIPTWNSAPARRIWLGASNDDGWFSDLNEAAGRLTEVAAADIWQMRGECRRRLVDYVRHRLTRQLQVGGATEEAVQQARHTLDPNVLTLGFARRFTEYKRPRLLLHDADRMKRILLNTTRPVQLIVAGKAHPNDEYGKQMVRSMARFAMMPELRNRVIFLEDYDMTLARHLAAGVDVWLNTPRRPAEACGTSGMKMLFNGGLNLSVSDGWWDEVESDDVGWTVGDGEEDDPQQRDAREALLLYELLEQSVIPLFYERDAQGVPLLWVDRIRASMCLLTARFSSDRMVRDYVDQAYIPAADATNHRAADSGKIALDLLIWQQQLEENWQGLHFGDVHVTAVNGKWQFSAAAYLGDVDPDSVQVQLYAEPLDDSLPVVIPMQRDHALPGAINGYAYVTQASAHRPAEHYTPRIVPWHPHAVLPLELPWIFWQR